MTTSRWGRVAELVPNVPCRVGLETRTAAVRQRALYLSVVDLFRCNSGLVSDSMRFGEEQSGIFRTYADHH